MVTSKIHLYYLPRNNTAPQHSRGIHFTPSENFTGVPQEVTPHAPSRLHITVTTGTDHDFELFYVPVICSHGSISNRDILVGVAHLCGIVQTGREKRAHHYYCSPELFLLLRFCFAVSQYSFCLLVFFPSNPMTSKDTRRIHAFASYFFIVIFLKWKYSVLSSYLCSLQLMKVIHI